jgi:hypothetical protein
MVLDCGECAGLRVESAADGLRKRKIFDRGENYRCSGDAWRENSSMQTFLLGIVTTTIFVTCVIPAFCERRYLLRR